MREDIGIITPPIQGVPKVKVQGDPKSLKMYTPKVRIPDIHRVISQTISEKSQNVTKLCFTEIQGGPDTIQGGPDTIQGGPKNRKKLKIAQIYQVIAQNISKKSLDVKKICFEEIQGDPDTIQGGPKNKKT